MLILPIMDAGRDKMDPAGTEVWHGFPVTSGLGSGTCTRTGTPLAQDKIIERPEKIIKYGCYSRISVLFTENILIHRMLLFHN